MYEGCLPDVMLSEAFLNQIPCISTPGTILMDTWEVVGDRDILRQYMMDTHSIFIHKFNQLSDPQSTDSFANATSGSAAAPSVSAAPSPPLPSQAASLSDQSERIKRLLEEMECQRKRLVERIGKPVSDEAYQSCLSVLERYPENFRPPGSDPCKLPIFKITLKDKSKFHICLPRRVNPIMLQEIRKQVSELVAAGTVERCTTHPNSLYAIVMAKKATAPGKWRLCIDLTELNSNTVPMPYAVPDVHEALDRLSGKKLYCTFDFSAWFHQFELDEEDRDKVAFLVPGDNLTPPQIYRYRRVAMGLLNSTYHCQRSLQEALEQFPDCQGIYPFVDDVVIAADTLEEMLTKLEAFMKFCKHYNIRLKKEKTELATGAVRHLGFILSEEGQSLDPARVSALTNIGAPHNLTGLKSLLGSFSFIRAWVADMAGIAAPLTDIMGKTATRLGFKWGEEQERALQALKAAVLLAPVKIAPDYTLAFHIFVDASDVGVACVLIQFRETPEGVLKPFPIHYHSRRFSAREARWSVSEREMYAIRYGLFKSKQWIQGHPDVTVWSDHLNLVTGLWTHCSPKIERWRLFIESFQPFKLRHVRGTSELQTVADSLSRLHIDNIRLPPEIDDEDPECVFWADRGEGELPGEHELFGEDAPTCSVAAAMHSLIAREYAAATAAERAHTKTDFYSRLYGKGAGILQKHGQHEQSRAPLTPKPQEKNYFGVGYKNKGQERPKEAALSLTCGSATSAIINVTTAVVAACFAEDSLCSTHIHSIEQLSNICEHELRVESSEGGGNRGATAGAVAQNTASAHTLPSHQHRALANPTAATETSNEDLRKAALKAKGGFTHRELLRLCHDHTHPSFTITWKRMVQATGVRPGRDENEMRAECKRYCDTCLVCQKLKPAKERVSAKLGAIRSRPFAQLAFDLIVLTGSEDAEGHKYILVVVDSFTHAIELFPLKRATADSVVTALHDVMSRFHRPHEIRHDNAKQFTAAVVQKLLKLTGVHQHTTPPYSHWTNGQVENANRRIMSVLRAMILDQRLGPLTEQRWSLLCPAVRKIINNRMVWRYGCTPDDLIYVAADGEASIFTDEPWMAATRSPDVTSSAKCIDELKRQHMVLIESCEELLDGELSRLLISNAAILQDSMQLRAGDYVLVDSRERPHKKLASPWFGPYLVIEQLIDEDGARPVALLQHLATKEIELFHVSMCKVVELDHFDEIDEAVKYAAMDVWEYEMEAILDHEPRGPRTYRSGNRRVIRRKEDYSFSVLWKDIPRDVTNPSWEPWANESLRQSHLFKEYCRRPEVAVELGADFILSDAEDEATLARKKRRHA
jgi:transposase InsO family protein